MAVTGNVIFAPDRMTFQNGASLSLSKEGRVRSFKGMGEIVDATVYRVGVPADLSLRNENHVCGDGKRTVPVTYIVVWHPKPLPGDKAVRAMAAFSGKRPTRSDEDATSCGVYNDLGD
jgi:hypothetical protein